MAKFPGTYGLGAPTYDTPAVASFIWGAGGQIATEQNGKWVAELTSPQSEAGIKFYVDLYRTYHVSPAKYNLGIYAYSRAFQMPPNYGTGPRWRSSSR